MKERNIKLLLDGGPEWTKFRRINGSEVIDFDEADFSGISRDHLDLDGFSLRNVKMFNSNLPHCTFQGADLTEANLEHSRLYQTSFDNANLQGADFRRSDMLGTSLKGADLRNANFRRADLRGTDLSGADLRGANFKYSVLREASLVGAKLEGAIFNNSVVLNSDFSDTTGLSDCIHNGPSTIDYRTLQLSGMLPSHFLKGFGLPDSMIDFYPSLLGNPISYYSCFISYSHADKKFARRLKAQLEDRGIRCWLDEHQLVAGDDTHEQIDRGIRLWDKVLLCCSKDSLTSWWVDNEIETTFAKERDLMKKRQKKVFALIPLNIDGYLFSPEYVNGKAQQIKSRHAPSFVGWEASNDIFENSLVSVENALMEGDSGREQPPISKL